MCRRLNSSQAINSLIVHSLQKQFPELFNESTGECHKVTVQLRLNAQPVHVSHRPIALALEEPINDELDRLVSNGILQQVDSSEWAAPIVIARKPNGKIRICADYSTGLNDVLDADEYPIPNMENLMLKNFKEAPSSHS